MARFRVIYYIVMCITAGRSSQFILKEISPDAEAETPILWPSDEESWLTGKDPDAGKDWRQEEKGTTDDEVVGWHHQCKWTWVWVGSGSVIDREAWRAAVRGVAKSQTRLSNWTDYVVIDIQNICQTFTWGKKP